MESIINAHPPTFSTLKIEYQHILYLPSAVGKPTSYKSRATADVSSPQPVSL